MNSRPNSFERMARTWLVQRRIYRVQREQIRESARVEIARIRMAGETEMGRIQARMAEDDNWTRLEIQRNECRVKMMNMAVDVFRERARMDIARIQAVGQAVRSLNGQISALHRWMSSISTVDDRQEIQADLIEARTLRRDLVSELRQMMSELGEHPVPALDFSRGGRS